MSDLENLIICRNYYEAKYKFIEMKIKKIQQLPTDTKYKQSIAANIIKPDPISEPEVEPDTEPDTDTESEEPDTDVSLFFKDKIIKDDKGKIKRSETYGFYKKFCKTEQTEPMPKPQFFEKIEQLVGQPNKTNGLFYYKNYSLVKSALTFNESVEELIF